MNDEISALLGGQYVDPNSAEAMALADQLRGSMRNADFLSLSSIAPVSRFGQQAREATVNAAETRGRLNRAVAEEQRALERQKDQEARALKRTIESEKREAERQAEENLRLENQYRQRLDDTRTSEQYVDKNGEVIMLDRDATGQLFLQGESADGMPLTRDDIEYMQLQKYDKDAKITAGRGNAKFNAEQQAKADRELLNIDFISDTMRDPLLQAATGSWYDIPRRIANWTGATPDVQSVQNELAQITADSAAPMLATLGVNPTDTDVEVAFGTVPQERNEPQVWLDWYRDRYAPRLLYMIERDNPRLLPMVKQRVTETLSGLQGNIDENKESDFFSFPQMSRQAKTISRAELQEYGLSEQEAIDSGYRVTN